MSVSRTFLTVLLVAATLAGAAAAAPLAQDEPTETITVSGQVRYFDRDGVPRPAAGIRVDIKDWDDEPSPGPNELLATVWTDSEGFFTASGIDNRDLEGTPHRWDGTGQDVLIELRTTSSALELINASTGRPYPWSSLIIGPGRVLKNVGSGTTVNLEMTVLSTDRNVRAMRVYQTLYAGWDFLPEKPSLSSPIKVQWVTGSTQGDYFIPGDRIYLTDAAEAYPHVVLHHFAHALAWAIQGDSGSPTGCFPSLTHHQFDLKMAASAGCAWTEGWAVFFSMAVLDNPDYRTPEGLINLEKPDAETPGWAKGDTVAGRVAGALYDLFDIADDGFDDFAPAGDTAAQRFAPLWDTYLDGSPTTLAEFWQAWLEGGHDACGGVRPLFQNTIDYNHAPTISALPGISLDEDEAADNAIDLWLYADDVECPDDRLSYTLVGDIPPEFGVSIDENRYIDVEPAADWFGTVEIQVNVSDGLETTRRFFTLTIGGVNDGPTLEDIPRFEAMINEPITVDLDPYVHDIDNLKTDLTAVAAGLEHAAVESAGLELTFTPEPDFEGTETARVHVEDPDGAVSRAVNLILIWSRTPNHRPKIVGLPEAPFRGDAGIEIVIDFTGYGEDEEDSPAGLTWQVEEVGEHASVRRINRTTLGFMPEPRSYLGSEVAKVVVQDKDGAQSDPAEIRLLWTPPTNQAPQITGRIPDQFFAFVRQPLILDLAGYALDADHPTSSLIWFPNKSTVDCCTVSLLREKQRIIFFPLPGWGTQTDEVELIVQDPLGAEDRKTVRLTWRLYELRLPLIAHNATGP